MRLTAFAVAVLAVGAIAWLLLRKDGILAQRRAKTQAAYNTVALKTAQDAIFTQEFNQAFRGVPPG